MVQILPQFDPGKEAGQAFGSGISDVLKMLGQRKMVGSALDQLGNMSQEEQNDPLKLTMNLLKATAGVPGLQQAVSESVLPQLIKRAQGSSLFEGNQGGSSEPQEQENAISNSGYRAATIGIDDLPNLIENLQNDLESQSNVINSSGNEYTSQIPRFGVNAPSYKTPTVEDLNRKALASVRAGASPDQAYKQIQEETRASLAGYEAKKEKYNRDLQDFSLKRGLEEEQINFLSGNNQNSGRIGNWLDAQGIKNEPYWHDIGYKMFSDFKNRNVENMGARNEKPKTDQQLWEDTKQRMKILHSLEARGNLELAKPNVLPWVQNQKAKDAFATSSSYADSYLKIAGNTPETRERLKSQLMNKGWDEDLAITMVQPPSQGAKNFLNKVPKFPSRATGMSENQGAQVDQERDSKSSYVNSVVDQITSKGENFLGPIDSVLLLRNKLMRDKGMGKYQANSVIEKLKDKGLLSENQLAEIPQLQKDPKMFLLFDVFTEGVEK